MRRCDDRPPLLEEPFAQTLSGNMMTNRYYSPWMISINQSQPVFSHLFTIMNHFFAIIHCSPSFISIKPLFTYSPSPIYCVCIYIYILSIIKPLLDHFHYSLTSFIWLVVSPPLLKNMSPSVGMMKFPIIWTKKMMFLTTNQKISDNKSQQSQYDWSSIFIHIHEHSQHHPECQTTKPWFQPKSPALPWPLARFAPAPFRIFSVTSDAKADTAAEPAMTWEAAGEALGNHGETITVFWWWFNSNSGEKLWWIICLKNG